MSRNRKKDKVEYGNGSPWLPRPYVGPGRLVDPRLPEIYRPAAKETFEFECEHVTECSRAKPRRCSIPASLWFDLLTLAQRDKDEWLCYLIGEETEDGISVSDVAFPSQVRGVANVEVTGGAPEHCVGKLHSHNTMKAFFSSTDRQHFNWPLEVVINARGEYEAVCRVKLPCGELMHTAARILVTGGSIEQWQEILDEVGKVEKWHGDTNWHQAS